MQVRLLRPDELVEASPRLLKIQQRAYAAEAVLIGDDRIPGLRESIEELRAAGLDWLVADDDDTGLVGALAFRLDGETVDIDRLVVDPDHHRRGIGRALVVAAIRLAGRAVVSTGRDNLPARRLYERLEFRHAGDREVLERLWVSDYIRPYPDDARSARIEGDGCRLDCVEDVPAGVEIEFPDGGHGDVGCQGLPGRGGGA